MPFLLSFILIVVGLFIRLSESPAFAKVKETHTQVKLPILDAIRTYPKQILLVMGARFAENGSSTSSQFSS